MSMKDKARIKELEQEVESWKAQCKACNTELTEVKYESSDHIKVEGVLSGKDKWHKGYTPTSTIILRTIILTTIWWSVVGAVIGYLT